MEFNYTAMVLDHFMNPRNVGEIENADAIGEAGSAECGDMMRIFLKIDNDIITDVKFKTFGCAAAIASSSMATEMIKGKTIDEVKKMTNMEVVDALGGLPEKKVHCSVMVESAIASAILNYQKRGEPNSKN